MSLKLEAQTIDGMKRSIEITLAQSGIDKSEARCEANWIVEHVSGLSPADQLLYRESIPDRWLREAETITRERLQHKPLSYILGCCYFYGLKLATEPGVFIPRADTEAVVDTALAIIHATGITNPVIADIGCGTGAIGIALLSSIPDASLYALDSSEKALALCRKNATANGLSKRITYLNGDWRETLPGNLDLIVSNPPYIPDSHASMLPAHIIDHEPHGALFGSDEDGLGYYREFARFARSHFSRSGGYLVCEIGDGQGARVNDIFAALGWADIKESADLSGNVRVITARCAIEPNE